MIDIEYSGRLGNILFIYSLASIISCKNKLKIKKQAKNVVKQYVESLNPALQYEEEVFTESKTDYLFHFTDAYKNNLNICSYYRNVLLGRGNHYQHAQLIDEYFDFYKNLYTLKAENFKPNDEDVFCHVRLGDIQNCKDIALPFEYYDQSISNFNFKNIFIASDSPNHPTVTKLKNKYNATIIDKSPSETISFGSLFKNLILSEGTFSFWIACLSSFNVCLIPSENRKKFYGIRKWHGDIFDCKSINWTKI